MDTKITGIFTRSARVYKQNAARLMGLPVTPGVQGDEEVCCVMFPELEHARNGESPVTCATISLKLAKAVGVAALPEIGYSHVEFFPGGMDRFKVDIIVDMDTYTPESGVHVKAAKRPDRDENGWLFAAEFE